MLIKKPIDNTKGPFDDAFDWFDVSETGNLSKSDLREFFKMFSPYSIMHRDDFKTILNKFDVDMDGQLNIEDFKRMSLA